jgi:MerR family transcriptional regulator, light-induced transcriptional regulator
MLLRMAEGHLRVGELSRRVGVSPELLRAWELRYGLLEPSRSPGGFRLYSSVDEERIKRMRAFQTQGFSAAEAARLALESTAAADTPVGDGAVALDRDPLAQALERFDEPTAQEAFDRALSVVSIESLLRDLVIPYLHDLGERWEAGTLSIAQEHFASNFLRGRLLGLARGWGQGGGPLAILACAPGEQHDLPLIAFGVALRAHGWRIAFLGPDTPLGTLADAAAKLAPRLVVVSATSAARLARVRDELGTLACSTPLALAGAGATHALAESVGADRLAEDPVTEADRVARSARARLA